MGIRKPPIKLLLLLLLIVWDSHFVGQLGILIFGLRMPTLLLLKPEYLAISVISIQ